MTTTNHFQILSKILQHTEGVDQSFHDIYEKYVEYELIPLDIQNKVRHGLNTWITEIPDVFTLLDANLHIWFYINLLRLHPQILKYIPESVLKDM